MSSVPVQLSVADREAADAMMRAVAPASGAMFSLTYAMVEQHWSPAQVAEELIRQLREQCPDPNLTTYAAMARSVKRLDMIYNSLTSRADDDAYFNECGEFIGCKAVFFPAENVRVTPGGLWAKFILSKSREDWIEERDRLKDTFTTITSLMAAYARQARLDMERKK